MRAPPSLARTGLTVIWTFIVASVVWTRVSGFYNDAIAFVANLLLPGDLWLDAFARTIRIEHVANGETYRQSVDSLVLHSGLLIVVALVAGTPWRTARWRATAAACMAAGFFLLQVAGVAVFALMLKRSLLGGVTTDEVNVGFAIFWALTPLLAGGVWGYRYWLPPFRVVPGAGMGTAAK